MAKRTTTNIDGKKEVREFAAIRPSREWPRPGVPMDPVHHVDRPGSKRSTRTPLLVAAAIALFTIAAVGLIGIVGVLRVMAE